MEDGLETWNCVRDLVKGNMNLDDMFYNDCLNSNRIYLFSFIVVSISSIIWFL